MTTISIKFTEDGKPVLEFEKKNNGTNRRKKVKDYKALKNYTAFDLETTGLEGDAEIIEIAAAKVRDGEIAEIFQELIKPTISIPQAITEITGITNEDVENCRNAHLVLRDFINFIEDDILLGHNIAAFDIPKLKYNVSVFLEAEFECEYIDTLKIAREVLPVLPSHSLKNLCEHYSITNESAHRALSDVLTNIKIFEKLVVEEHGENGEIAPKRIYNKNFSQETQSIIALRKILSDITCDDALDENGILYLKDWLINNENLKGGYPFDIIFKEINAALDDGVLEQHELDHLLTIFKEVLDPVGSMSENTENIDFSGKGVCLTGDFVCGSREDVSQKLSERGAILKSDVSKKVDFLIVGGNGSEAWSCGNYGGKVKKALELQGKGHSIKILKESDVFVPANI